MSQGALLLAHGTPDCLDEMPEYLTRVRGGRAPSEELLAEMRGNYGAIGGRSPLTDLTTAQAAALEAELGFRVLVGMRNWKPFIADALAQARREGIRQLAVVPMAPQYSSLSVGKYREAVNAALPADVDVAFVETWCDHPDLVAAFAERLEAALKRHAPDHVIFTAHSLPTRVIEAGDPYAEQVVRTARAVAARAGLARYEQAWQSAGRTPEPWLGPSLEEYLGTASSVGARRVLVVPIGFVCDHTEILFDIDIQARAAAEAAGLELFRAESLNLSPTFIRALASVVRKSLATAA